MIKRYIDAFNTTLKRKEFNYTATQISEWSGLGISQVSRFLNGKTDLPVSKYFQLLNAMPPQFQESYWEELLGLETDNKDWYKLIISASANDVKDILSALSEWTAMNSQYSGNHSLAVR